MILVINAKDSKVVVVELKDKNNHQLGTLEDHNHYGSQALLPLILKILEKHKLTFKDLTAIEVEEGPGSFTGLRVGASVAQALGYALDIPVNGQIGKPVELRYTE